MPNVTCSECGADVPSHARYCSACAADVGFPNVRLANRADEQSALAIRVQNAKTSATARGIASTLDVFGITVATSRSVVARDLGTLHSLVKSENTLYISFHQQVRSSSRIPEDNKWDRGRAAEDNTINPIFFDQINFACLSLDGMGASGYGDYHITLKDKLIERRTTVFEENPFIFCQRHRIIAGDAPPLGYRATWENRGLLAVAKLQAKITVVTTPDQFPGVLVQRNAKPGSDDFIEAHIYGPLHRSTIERVIGPRPRRGAELVIWKSVVKTLRDIGAAVEERV